MTPALLLHLSLALLLAGQFLFKETARRVGSQPPVEIGQTAQDLAFKVEDGRTLRISDFRGKWLLIMFGSTASPRAEVTSGTCSHIREALEGYPFEFVQIFDSPSALDARLFNFSQFHGLVAVPAETSSRRQIPRSTWMLVDPDGAIRAAGNYHSRDEMRSRLSAAWAGDSRMPQKPLEATDRQKRMESVLANLRAGRREEVRAATRQILAEDPGDELALRSLLQAGLFLDGYSETNKEIAARVEGLRLSDETWRYILLSRLMDSDRSENRDLFAELFERYPESRHLRCIDRMLNSLPDEAGPEELVLFEEASETTMRYANRAFRAFALQWAGRLREAEAVFRQTDFQDPLQCLGLADTLHRLGNKAATDAMARRFADKPMDELSLREAWVLMHLAFVTGDDERTAELAGRYSALRAEKPQGPLIAWLLELLAGKADTTHAGRVLQRIAEDGRYARLRAIDEKGGTPTTRDLTDLADDIVRFDTALYFICKHWADATVRDRCLASAQRAFLSDNWAYAVLNNIRWRLRAGQEPRDAATEAQAADLPMGKTR